MQPDYLMEIHDNPAENIRAISLMSHEQMARLFRFAQIGHPFFDCRNAESAAFEKRFRELGGMTSEMSKRIGHTDTTGVKPAYHSDSILGPGDTCLVCGMVFYNCLCSHSR